MIPPATQASVSIAQDFCVLVNHQFRLISVYNGDGKIFQAHCFDFWSKHIWKREQFSIVLNDNNGDPPVIEWRIFHICKTDVAQTFGS